jgi:hypothetical protein
MHPSSIVLLGAWLCIQFITTVRARYNCPISSTRRWMTKSLLSPLRAGLRTNEYSSFEDDTGSQSPPSEGSSEVKYDIRRRASPLPVDIIGFLPIPPVMSTSTSTSDHPPPDAMTERRLRQAEKTAYFIARAVEVHGDQYDYSLSEYGQSGHVKVTIICTKHDPPITFEQRPFDHLYGRGCRTCGTARSNQARRGNTAEFIARATEIHGDQYDYSLTEYGKTSKEKVTIICTRHDPPITFEQTPDQHLCGHGCFTCGTARKGQKLSSSTAEFIARATEMHGDQYDYSLTDYVEAKRQKVVIICTRHNPPFAFEQTPTNHLSGRGCRRCANENRIGWQPRSNTDEFIARAVEIHGDKYDYSLSEYGKKNSEKVTIICTRHDPPITFEQTPNQHLCGRGCHVCGIERTRMMNRGSTAEFIARATEMHGDQYDYSLSEYGRSSVDNVTIICTRHDPPITFEMGPKRHLSGHGCRICGTGRVAQALRGNTADFIARATEIHGDQYDYSLTEYGKTSKEKVTIICTRHDPPITFEQSPNHHLLGKGCRTCGNARKGQRKRGTL